MGFLDDVGFDERVVYPSIKKCHCSSLQNTLVATSCPASVSLFAELLNQSIVRPSSHFICHLFIQHISHHIKNLVVYLVDKSLILRHCMICGETLQGASSDSTLPPPTPQSNRIKELLKERLFRGEVLIL